MPNNLNMIPIQTVTVGSGGTTSIEFNPIPQTYTDLLLRLSVRSTRSGTYEGGIGIGINGNRTTGYSWRTIEVQGTSVTSNNTSYEPDWTSRIPASQTTSGIFSNVDVYIPNYTSSNSKAYFSDGIGERNSATASLTLLTGLQTSTSPITSLSIHDQSNTLLTQFSTATLYGITAFVGETGAKALGGVVTTSGGYTYHTFTTSGNFTPTTSISNAEVLIVAGGGSGGGWDIGGGGGAGGLVYASGQTLTSGTNYSAVVGAGGPAIRNNNGSSGSNSKFGSLTTAVGGGRGTGSGSPMNGVSGGSGGGAGEASYTTGTGGSPTSGQGNAGGNSTGNAKAGGGGGFGAAGQASNAGSGGGNGTSSYSAWGAATSTGHNLSGTYWYAGGGGGGVYGSPAGSGGNGGGGAGATANSSGSNGLASTGGGGGGTGGGNPNNITGAGGSGIIIVRYPN